jgi:acylphosphatase
MSCARICVSGLVQGVFFRHFTQVNARELKLRGWVRNLPDGRVEAEAVGERGLIEDLIKQLRVGPPASRVTGVEVQWLTQDPEYTSFDVRYF